MHTRTLNHIGLNDLLFHNPDWIAGESATGLNLYQVEPSTLPNDIKDFYDDPGLYTTCDSIEIREAKMIGNRVKLICTNKVEMFLDEVVGSVEQVFKRAA